MILNSSLPHFFQSLGVPEVTMTGIKSDLDVSLVPLGNNTYRASYIADDIGVYLLNVMWAERLPR